MFLQILSVIGAVCLFLFGMKLISDSLQKMSGQRMRRVIHRLTNTKGRGFFSGFALTSLIQTSSASTLLVVGLVNAGVISLMNSVPLIIGANLGTTVKLWLISTLGFQFDIGAYALILVAAGFPFLFMKLPALKSFGEFLIGFAILFLGLFYMKSVFPIADEHSVFYQWVQNTSQSGFPGVLLFVLLGIVITSIIQSSSAAITLTFVLCYHGVVDFPMAVALVLGQNIGTTVTVNIGALVGSVNAKRAALAHLFMNLITVLLLLPFFNYFVMATQMSVESIFQIDLTNPNHLPLGLTFVHTVFNILLSLIMLPSVAILLKLTEFILPASKSTTGNLKIIEDGLFATSEFSLLHAKTSMIRFAVQVKKMFSRISILLVEKKNKKYNAIFQEIVDSEKRATAVNNEISDYLAKISQRDISRESSRIILKMIEISDEIEKISSLQLQFAQTVELKNAGKAWFDQEMRESLDTLIQITNDAAEIMIENLSGDFIQVNFDEATSCHEQFATSMKSIKQKYNPGSKPVELPNESIEYFNQMLLILEKISDGVFEVSRIVLKSASVNGNQS
jgi:phosphate:Na+ symporter